MSHGFAGIALENQSKMFNEFMQFNRNTLQGGGGSGLGLWICKNLATLHGGNLVRNGMPSVVVMYCNRSYKPFLPAGLPLCRRRNGLYLRGGTAHLQPDRGSP